MNFLLDTNVLSELRRGRKADPNVRAWDEAQIQGRFFISVISLGEIRSGVERMRRRDARQAARLNVWMDQLLSMYARRILEVDRRVAEQWGRLNAFDPLPTADALLAATALVHGLTVATRDVRDFARTGVALVNPFAPA